MYDIEWVNQMALDLFSAGHPTPAESPDLADGRREWPREGQMPTTQAARKRFVTELLALGATHEQTRPIQDVWFYPSSFPVDVRHNAKIQREKLAVWAETQLQTS